MCRASLYRTRHAHSVPFRFVAPHMSALGIATLQRLDRVPKVTLAAHPSFISVQHVDVTTPGTLDVECRSAVIALCDPIAHDASTILETCHATHLQMPHFSFMKRLRSIQKRLRHPFCNFIPHTWQLCGVRESGRCACSCPLNVRCLSPIMSCSNFLFGICKCSRNVKRQPHPSGLAYHRR